MPTLFHSPFSSQNTTDGLASAEAQGAAQGIDQLARGVDAEQVVDGGGDVGRGDGVARGVGGPPVAGAEDRSALDAGTGEHRGETVRPVVAAVSARPGTADDRLADARVRPNSPVQTMSVESSRPRAARSSSRALKA